LADFRGSALENVTHIRQILRGFLDATKKLRINNSKTIEKTLALNAGDLDIDSFKRCLLTVQDSQKRLDQAVEAGRQKAERIANRQSRIPPVPLLDG
jgi:hypothetical protein